jgi:hypothetical protein
MVPRIRIPNVSGCTADVIEDTYFSYRVKLLSKFVGDIVRRVTNRVETPGGAMHPL